MKCEVCGVTVLKSNNKHGVCQKTPECRREHSRRYYAANPERQLEATRRWQAKQPAVERDLSNLKPCAVCSLPTSSKWEVCGRTRECRREMQRRNRAANPDHCRQVANARRAANPEAWREYYRQRYHANPEAARASHRRQYERSREAHFDRSRRYRARKSALPTEKIDETVLWNRQSGLCGECHKPMVKGDTHLDHIIPIASGKGGHLYCNVQLTHPRCNMSKHAKVDWDDPRIQAILAECERFGATPDPSDSLNASQSQQEAA